eukprot:scaffold11866_cov117-Isochrysis_galbana.AAC.2
MRRPAAYDLPSEPPDAVHPSSAVTSGAGGLGGVACCGGVARWLCEALPIGPRPLNDTGRASCTTPHPFHHHDESNRGGNPHSPRRRSPRPRT